MSILRISSPKVHTNLHSVTIIISCSRSDCLFFPGSLCLWVGTKLRTSSELYSVNWMPTFPRCRTGMIELIEGYRRGFNCCSTGVIWSSSHLWDDESGDNKATFPLRLNKSNCALILPLPASLSLFTVCLSEMGTAASKLQASCTWFFFSFFFLLSRQ